MPAFQLQRKQRLHATIGEVWDFISSPSNLKEITPPHMGFDIIGDRIDRKMYAGQIITYTVRPVLGVAMRWVTEITHVRELEYFVDEQRVGPYKLWHHQHIIEPVSDGVVMTDIVTYVPPFGWIGSLANRLWIRKELESIFNYRHEILDKKFRVASKVFS